MNTIDAPFQNEGYWFDCQKDNPSVDQQSYEEIDILGSDVTCCNCKKVILHSKFFSPYNDKYEITVYNGAFERFFGYACKKCQKDPNLFDILLAKNRLCLLSTTAINNINKEMTYEYDRIATVVTWKPTLNNWCLNYYTIPNSSTRPLFGKELGFEPRSEIRSLLKKQPREVLNVLLEKGVPYSKLPYRKIKVVGKKVT
jgi:hypothetical protein